MSGKLTITETEPTPILRDFAAFIHYVEAHPITLTPAHDNIPGGDLYEINRAMANPVPDTTSRTNQNMYPLLHLFFHLSLAGKLFQKIPGKGGRLALKPTERLRPYDELKPAEKYFFLLETLWTDADWGKLRAGYIDQDILYLVPTVLEVLSALQPGRRIPWQEANEMPGLGQVLFGWGYFAMYFSYFGFWQVTRVQEAAKALPSKRLFRAEAMTPSAFGVALASVLYHARSLPYWNLPSRRQEGEWNAVAGSPLPKGNMYKLIWEDMEGGPRSKKKKVVQMTYRGKPGEPFFQPFVPLFTEGELERTLPREGVKFVDGTYVFKVAMRTNLYRRIEASANHTLLDLHHAIQQAYQFDDDHLYSFYMDGDDRSRERFTSPYEDEGPHVDEVRIGELGLYVGQRILYLFDYGDMWRFRVEVEAIRSEGARPRKPKIVEKKGKAPEQYPDIDQD